MFSRDSSASDPGRSGPSAFATSSGLGGSVKLEFGKHYTGTVVRANNSKLSYAVRLDDPAVLLPNCWYLTGTVATLIGLQRHAKLFTGQPVVVLGGNPGIILGGLPSEPPDVEGAGAKHMGIDDDLDIADLEEENAEDDEAQSFMGTNVPPVDQMVGEEVLINALGVGVKLLTFIAELSGGDRAKITCSVLDDTVRILSDTFKHFSSFGDMQIYRDGAGLNVRWDGTSYDHEAWGLEEDKARASVEENKVNVTPEDAAESGRWRFSMFMGRLGNFISMFISDPVQGLGQLAQQRAGKSFSQWNMDGSFILRSVADISFERVCRVVVPVEKKRWDAADGTTRKMSKQLDNQFLKIWKANPDSPWEAAYTLREYARWLGCFHGYARFLQNTEDWEVPTEAESPAPDYANGEEDVNKAAGADTQVIETYSCIRLFRDGSSLIYDGYGSARFSGGGNIHESCSGNYTIEAGGDIRLLSAQSIFAKARRNIELSASVGGLVLKSRTVLKALCEKGTLWLKGDANSNTNYTPETGDPEAQFLKYGVLIDAAEGSLGLLGRNSVVVHADGQGDDQLMLGDESLDKTVRIQSQNGKLILGAKTDIWVRAQEKLLIAANSTFQRIQGICHILTKSFDINQVLTLERSDLHCKGTIRATRGKFVVDLATRKIAARTDSGSRNPKCPLTPHSNHVSEIKAGDLEKEKPVNLANDELTELREAGAALPTLRGPLTGEQNANWGPSEDEELAYKGDISRPSDRYYRSLSQQFITSDLDSTGVETWNLAQDQLHKANRTQIKNLFPGAQAKMRAHTSAQESLHAPCSTNYAELPNEAPSMRDDTFELKYPKRG